MGWVLKVPKIILKLDLESIMSSLRMDFEKEGISITFDWDLKILNWNWFRKRRDLKISIFESYNLQVKKKNVFHLDWIDI